MVKIAAPLLPPDVTGPFTERFKAAQVSFEAQPDEAARSLLEIILDDSTPEVEDVIMEGVEQEDPAKVKEAAVYLLGQFNVRRG